MSRASGKAIPIPEQVNINFTESSIEIRGPKGKLNCNLHPDILLKNDNGNLLVITKDNSKEVKSLSGTYRSILNNMIQGVTSGYEKKLIIVGVGYKVSVNNNILNMNIGYSHPINYVAPDGITIVAPIPTEIVVRGSDKQKVGQTAAEIRSYRKPEPYKGKGIRYENEIISLKETKKK